MSRLGLIRALATFVSDAESAVHQLYVQACWNKDGGGMTGLTSYNMTQAHSSPTLRLAT